MSGVFDRRQLRRAFGRAAPNYAAVAALQREVETRLLEQLDYLDDRQPARILDLGSGPGRAAGAMKKRWPKAEVLALDAALPMLREVPRHTRFWRPVKRVCADVTALPLADQCADVIFSSLCLQWVEDLPTVLAEFRRVLRPDGLLLFSTFGPGTLAELREAYEAVGEVPPLSPFAAIQLADDVGRRAVRRLEQRVRVADVAGRRHAQAADQRRGEVLPSTWEVITAQAWGPAPGAPRRSGGADLASFPADRIPLRRR